MEMVPRRWHNRFAIKRIITFALMLVRSLFWKKVEIDAKTLSIDKFFSVPARIGYANLKYCARQAKLNGHVMEFGVAGGVTTRKLSKYFSDELIWGFDSFEGLPEEWVRAHDFIVPKKAFSEKRMKTIPRNVRLIKGFFKETLPQWLRENPGDVKFIHIDCDLYSSAKTVLELLDSRIKTGTVIVFDELYSWNPIKGRAYRRWMNGEWKALKEWVEEYNRSFSILNRSTGEAVGIIVLR